MAEADRPGRGDAGDETPAAAAAPGAKKSVLRRLTPYAIAGLLSAGLGATAGIVTKPKQHDEPEKKEPAGPVTPYDSFGEPFEVTLPPIVSNLADPNQSVSGKFVITLELRIAKETEKAVQEALAADVEKGSRMVRVKDALLMLFTSKHSTDIKPAHGKEVLKYEIRNSLSPLLFPDPAQGVITNVYFTDFVIQ